MLGIKELESEEHAETSRTKNTLVVLCAQYVSVEEKDVLFEEEACMQASSTRVIIYFNNLLNCSFSSTSSTTSHISKCTMIGIGKKHTI